MRGVAHFLTVEELRGVADSAHGFTGSDLTTVCMQGKLLNFFQLCRLHVHSLLLAFYSSAQGSQKTTRGEGGGGGGGGEVCGCEV